MNRRTFLKSLAVGAAGILVPSVAIAEEPARRIWALGGLPERKRYFKIEPPLTYDDNVEYVRVFSPDIDVFGTAGPSETFYRIGEAMGRGLAESIPNDAFDRVRASDAARFYVDDQELSGRFIGAEITYDYDRVVDDLVGEPIDWRTDATKIEWESDTETPDFVAYRLPESFDAGEWDRLAREENTKVSRILDDMIARSLDTEVGEITIPRYVEYEFGIRMLDFYRSKDPRNGELSIERSSVSHHTIIRRQPS